MIEEIKRRLDAGEVVELECVDKEGYKRENSDERWSVLNLDKIIVTSAQLVAVSIKNANVAIMRYELKYFRIKRPAPTFDDLIDVALTALKDRVLSGVELEHDGVESLRYWTDKRSDCNVIFAQHNNYQDGIDFINSLYTETFVIESEEDYNSLKGGANIKLLNGEVIKRIVNYSPRTPEFSDANGRVVRLSYLTLKGATVTQKRG